MMPELVLEQYALGKWMELGSVEPGMPGSISNHASGHREIIRFRFEGAEVIIDRSLAGMDTEEGGESGKDFRRITTAGWEVIKRLQPGEDYEFAAMTDNMTEPARVRLRYKAR